MRSMAQSKRCRGAESGGGSVAPQPDTTTAANPANKNFFVCIRLVSFTVRGCLSASESNFTESLLGQLRQPAGTGRVQVEDSLKVFLRRR